MTYAVVTASLKNVYEPIDITFDIGMRVCYGISYSGLCPEVDYCVKISVGKKAFS